MNYTDKEIEAIRELERQGIPLFEAGEVVSVIKAICGSPSKVSSKDKKIAALGIIPIEV